MTTETNEPYTHPAVGEETVHIECMTPDVEPEFCPGWSIDIDLDEPAFEAGDRVVLPGFDGICPGCGDSCFRVEGRELTFHV